MHAAPTASAPLMEAAPLTVSLKYACRNCWRFALSANGTATATAPPANGALAARPALSSVHLTAEYPAKTAPSRADASAACLAAGKQPRIEALPGPARAGAAGACA